MAKDLKSIFSDLKILLQKYSPPFTDDYKLSSTSKTQYGLVSKKEVLIAGRKREMVYFAGLIIQKNYVGFYYMPVYTTPEIKKVFQPELLKTLKGKSCFYIKDLTPTLKSQIRSALKIGFQLYKKNSWV